MNTFNDQEWSSEVSENNTSIISYGEQPDDVLDLSFIQYGIKFEEDNHCYWGEDCSNCKDYTGKEEDRFCMECDQCNKPMTDHEGYVVCDRDLYCNLCILDNDYDERYAEFFKSFDENMDYHLWLDNQIKLYGNDPQFQRNLNSFAPARYQYEEDTKITLENAAGVDVNEDIWNPEIRFNSDWKPVWTEEAEAVMSEDYAQAPIKHLLMEINRVIEK